jgi:RimJ/RimL family protein N-acetyltransferase
MIAFGHDRQVADWVCSRLEVPTPINPAALGAVKDGKLIGGVVYINFRGCDIEMYAAADSPRWITRAHLDAFFGYPFRQLNCLRVTAVIERRNKHAREFVERLGFRLEGSHPRAMDGRTALTYGMLREYCRWIGEKHGQEKRQQRASSA